MFIVNSSSLSNEFKCCKRLAMYLMKQYKIPLLSQDKDVYYFAKTDLLEKILSDLPWYVKIFCK